MVDRKAVSPLTISKPVKSLTLLILSGLAAAWLLRPPASPPLEAAAAITAEDGKAVYEQHCLACHGTDARGRGSYPSLVGSAKTKSYDRAYSFISQNMPQNAPGSLKEDEYKAVTKYVLSLNGIPTDFSDLDDYWANEQINALYDKKYIDGYTDKDGKLVFKPNQNITRAEFVRYLVKAKEMFLSNSDATDLTDIAGLKGNKIYVITAVDNGIIEGYPDHTFKPGSPITRAEIATILMRSELLGAPATGSPPFKDVPTSHWAGGAVAAVREAHLFDGYEDGTFRPESRMTRGEAAAVIYRLVNPQ